MPKWGWWVAALLLAFMVLPFDQMSRGYWFSGWWRTITHRPLGDWHLYDVVPLFALYAVARVVVAVIDSALDQEIEKTPPGESGAQQK